MQMQHSRRRFLSGAGAAAAGAGDLGALMRRLLAGAGAASFFSSSSSSTNAFGSSLPEALARGGWDGAWRESVTPW